MSVIDIHPEELFDKLVAGTLSEVEGERLRAHLVTCDVCRFELAVRGDFPAELQSAEPQRPEKPRRRARRAFVWIGAAAASLVATGALASVLAGKMPWRSIETQPAKTGNHDRQAPARGKSANRDAPASAPTALTTSEPSTSSSVNTPAAAHGTAGSAARKVSRAGQSGSSSSAALFSEANRARGKGDLAHAVKLYRLLQHGFPESPEAVLSQLTLATLLLHTGDSRGALAGFDTYLARGSRPLEAEALVGRALALRALGRNEAERTAWKAVLDRYPGTSYARRASDRLAAVGRL